ncbi:UDP binding domain-containing protein, partial [Nesterenkonia sp. PF2B19]|uniref:UDP binding domain-containing protein n=1 Tax=Nesterenkonia sp. PF2B19 TaxID=1881858 RepID=UPI000A2340DE
ADALNEVGKPLNGSSVLLLGVTYKPDIADQRESPAVPVAKVLTEKKAEVRFHDPYVESWHVDGGVLQRVPDLEEALVGADVVVILQPHGVYDLEAIGQVVRRAGGLVFDTRGATISDDIERL